MSYEALARKYRPRVFEEVVGQEPIVRTLTNAIRAGRIHHAYVFSGVRGVGKTTIARIFAKALNCEKGPSPTPCLACDACIEISSGRDLDVIEMDAASRTGIDNVRDLIDTTRYAPARDRYKIFIIDEFHMLSKPAFNALLKTLEEPPPRVVFLMATTELHKVPPTVLSRTQQFDFRKVPPSTIADQLAMIAEKEGVRASRACLAMLARAADGSVRDAESLLDQAIAFCGDTLREAEVRTLLGLVPEETVESFLTAAADRDAGAMIRLIAAALAEGHDLRILHAGLIEGVRRLLVLKALVPGTGPARPPQTRAPGAGEASDRARAKLENPLEILGLSDEEEKRLAALAERFGIENLLRLFSVLAGLEAPLRYSEQPRYLFEAAAIRIAALANLAPIEELIARFEEEESGDGPPSAPGSRSAPRPTGGTAPPPAAPERTGPSPSTPPKRTRSEAPHGSPEAARGSSEPVASESHANRNDLADETVGRFLANLREKKMSLAMLVESAASVLFEDDRLVLLFEESQAFARKSIEQEPNLAILGEAARELRGRPLAIEVRRSGEAERAAPPRPPSEEPQTRSPEGRPVARATASRPPEPIATTAPTAPSPRAAGSAKYERLLSQALEDPIVKNLMRRFGGRIVEVKEVP